LLKRHISVESIRLEELGREEEGLFYFLFLLCMKLTLDWSMDVASDQQLCLSSFTHSSYDQISHSVEDTRSGMIREKSLYFVGNISCINTQHTARITGDNHYRCVDV
jgi:hypothetical protein